MVFAGAMVVVLAAGLAGLALAGRSGPAARAASVSPVAHRARAAQATRATRRAPSVSAVSGSTCFVGVPYCSESPCTEYVAVPSSTVYVVPAIRQAQPIRGCSGQRRRSRAAASAAFPDSLQVITAQLARRLAAQHPAVPAAGGRHP